LISSGRSRSSYLQKKGQIDIDEDGNAVCLHHPFYLYFIGSLCVLRNLTPESELTEAGKLGKLIDLGLGWSFVGKSPGIGLKAGYFFAHFPSDSSSLGHRYEEWNKGSFYISLDIELPNSWGIVGKPLSPPRLSASASFSDPQGNDDDVLNPEEKGTLSVDLRNRGQGLARDVRIVPQVENKELEDKIKFR